MTRLFFLLPVVLLLVSWTGVSVLVKNRIDYSASQTKAFPLQKPMQTSYTPAHDFLNIITLRLKNPNVEDTSNYQMELIGESGEVIKSVEFSARNVGDPSDLRLQFDPIPDSHSIRALRLSPLGMSGTLHVYLDDADGISFISYYKSPSRLPNPVMTLGRLADIYKKDILFFIPWSISLLLLVCYEILWPKRF